MTDFGSAEQNESRAQVAQGFSSCFAKLLTHLMNFLKLSLLKAADTKKLLKKNIQICQKF